MSELNEIERSDRYDRWFKKLATSDPRAAIKVAVAVDKFKRGNFGDCKPIGNGLSETRLHFGPGYRIYHKRVGKTIYLLITGGSKRTQARDIKEAKKLASEV